MNYDCTVDYYKILDLDYEASSREIKRAYHVKAREWHPDLHRNSIIANRKMQKINTAYEILSDPITKQRYDQAFFSYTSTKEIRKSKNNGVDSEWSRGGRGPEEKTTGFSSYAGFFLLIALIARACQ